MAENSKKSKADARQERLSEQLRANLKRRKGQKKARNEGEDEAIRSAGLDVNRNDGGNEGQGS